MKRNFPVWLGVVLFILAGALLMNLFQKTETGSPPVVKSDVQQAPDFTLQDLKGNTVSLSDFHGKNIYLNFWASWCGPCKMEMPDLEKIYQKYRDKDLIVLAVNIAENKETVEAFIKANNFSFPVLLDSQAVAAKAYKATSIPLSVFINKEGIIVARWPGLMTYDQMEAYIGELYK